MLLIIEGMDRCGKSTLVDNLRKRYFYTPYIFVHHSSSPPKRVLDPNDWETVHYDSMFYTSKRLIEDYGYTFIYDRFHLGAIVYGQKYRKADPEEIYQIDKHHLNGYFNSALVLLTDYPESIYARDDGDSLESTIEDYEETRQSFIEAFDRSFSKNKLHINITDNGGFMNTFSTVEKFLNGVKSK